MLPLPPTANRYWRHVGGRVLKSRDARTYLDTCQLVAVAQYNGRPLEGRCRIVADFHMTGLGDLDNRVKQLLDALQGIAFYNDSQCWDIHLRRHQATREQRVEVEVTPL